MKMEQTECSETSAYKIQTPGNYPEENIQHTEHGESFKSRNILHTVKRRKANWIGHVLCRNCLLKQVIEGKVQGRVGVT
jgi:hypothetical protein